MDYIGYIIAGVVLLLGIVLLVCGYLKAPPDTALGTTKKCTGACGSIS